MGAAKSLHDALASQQYTRRNNPAGFDAGCPDGQQGTRSEWRTRTRVAADSREMCTKAAVPRLVAHFQSGDLIFFASTRKNLDVFHAGIIVRDGKRVLMRHASRSEGLVVEQELGEFLKANRTSGVIGGAAARGH